MLKRRLSVLAVLMVLIAALVGCAETMTQGTSASGAKFDYYTEIVDSAFVKQVVDGKVKGAIFDSRPVKPKYDKGHVPGAIALPWSQFKKQAASKLPKDKDALLVFYCGGLACPLSHKSAYAAQAMGYTNIKVYATGYPSWKKAYGPGPNKMAEDITATGPKFKVYPNVIGLDYVKKIADGKTVGLVIDSRPKKTKYDKGHIPGAISLPTSQFEKMKGMLPADKKTPLVFYCGGLACPLSHKAAYLAQAMGYKNIGVLATGYPSWKKAYGAGVAAAAAKSAPAKKSGPLKAGASEGSVDPAAFAKALGNNPSSVMVIDVRDDKEFAAGSITGAVHMPADKLEKKLEDKSWKPAKPIVFVCSTGARSGEAYYMVLDLRPDLKDQTYFLDGEVAYDGKGGYKYSAPK
jgi:rhodanese-related sulfurtransferase